MTTVTNRPFRDAADLQLMADLIRQRPAERAADYPSISDLYAVMGTTHGRTHTRLWQGDGENIIGFAWIDPRYHALWYEVAVDEPGNSVENGIIAWGAEQTRQTQQEMGTSVSLRISCRDDHFARIRLLQDHGFIARPVRTLHLSRSLREPIPEPELPPGFSTRHVVGEHEAEALTALHRAAFGTQNLTVDARLAWMRMPDYDPGLDLVVVEPNGSLAAYCLCYFSWEENNLTGRNVGYADPLATHLDFQRRGLARVLLLTGLRLLRQHDLDSAALSTWGENIAMQRVAESVGFAITATTIFWQKEVG